MKAHCSSFFQNRGCEYFPCHRDVPEEEFNCLFCYCPLYLLGADCGGDFVWLPDGIKDCSGCTRPHREGGHEAVTEKYPLIIKAINKERK